MEDAADQSVRFKAISSQIDERRGSIETAGSSTDSRSSSKASIDNPNSKPSKPRPPSTYAERKSSISSVRKRSNSSGQIKSLTLAHSTVNSIALSNKSIGMSPSVSASTPITHSFSPVSASESSKEIATQEHRKSENALAVKDIYEDPPYFPLPQPSLPETDVVLAPATQMYWHKPTTHGALANCPPRRCHSIAQIGPSFYIFGGSDGKHPKATNTIFIFDADTSLWRIPKVGGSIPPPLRGHTTSAFGNRICLFGGGSADNIYYNHVYVFSTHTYRWTRIQESNRQDNSLPVPRRAHTSAIFGSGMYIFGGGSGIAGLNDLWRLDLQSPTPKWTQLHPIGRKPEPRVYHTATVVRDVMIIYGGIDGKQCFSNLFLYNFTSNTFTEILIPRGPRPCRISHTTTCVGNQLFVFGGSNGTVYNNELWIFDLTSKTWSCKGCKGIVPGRRGYHTAAYYDSRLWVFGGMDTLWEGFGDVHVLEFGGNGYLGSVYVDNVR